MKTKIAILLIFATTGSAFGQLLTYGPKVALSVSSFLDNENYKSDGSVIGYNIGFFLVKELPAVYLHFEPTYSFNLGGTFKDTYFNPTSTTISDISTLTLPVLVGKKLSKFRLFLGLAPGLALANSTYGDSSAFLDYVLGAGVDVSSIMFSIRYSSTLNRGLYDTQQKLAQVTFNVGIKLNKN